MYRVPRRIPDTHHISVRTSGRVQRLDRRLRGGQSVATQRTHPPRRAACRRLIQRHSRGPGCGSGLLPPSVCVTVCVCVHGGHGWPRGWPCRAARAEGLQGPRARTGLTWPLEPLTLPFLRLQALGRWLLSGQGKPTDPGWELCSLRGCLTSTWPLRAGLSLPLLPPSPSPFIPPPPIPVLVAQAPQPPFSSPLLGPAGQGAGSPVPPWKPHFPFSSF